MKYLLLVAFALHFSLTLRSQPAPCTGDPAMTSFCVDACVICDIDGFTGRNTSMGRGQDLANGPFCTTFTHNMNFIAFIAGTTDLQLEVDVSNCTIFTGLEIGIFESADCENFTPVTFCNTDVRPNSTGTFTNDVPLVVGQHYYLMMDGSSGDVCDWTFRVTRGSTQVSPLTTSGTVSPVVPQTCPDFPTRFNVMGTETGAALFYWDIDGQRVNTTSAPATDLTFPADGTYEVCVTAANVCDEAPPSCTTIDVRTVGTLALDLQICEEDTLFVVDTFLTTSGTFNFVVTLPNGCDSLIDVNLEVLPQARQTIDINLCVGEEYFIGSTPYSATGIFQDTILTNSLCDSVVTLDLFMIECEIIGATDFLPPVCAGEASGQILFSVQNGTPPFSYTWENILVPGIGGAGSTSLLVDNTIMGVPAGQYEINIQDNFGNDVVLFQTVTEPLPLEVSAVPVTIGDFNLSCFGGADGEIAGSAAGGVSPYSFAWSTTEAGSSIEQLAAGEYRLSVSDANGCVRTDTIMLAAPPAIAYTVAFNDPSCDGFETGSVELTALGGGTAPFRMALNNGALDTFFVFPDLPTGNYSVLLEDANGCRVDTAAGIAAPEIPVIFPWEPTAATLGCDVVIPTLINDINLASVRWLDPAGTLDCATCLRPRALPYNDTEYILTVISADGCAATDSVMVTVIKDRAIYQPTAFSPNGDGVNDTFIINPGKSVAAISSFRVFGRWGEQLFEHLDVVPNDPGAGWDGRHNGEQMPPGMYVWSAQVLFLDGEAQELSGEVVLLR